MARMSEALQEDCGVYCSIVCLSEGEFCVEVC